MLTVTYPGIRVEDGHPEKIIDTIISEDRFRIFLNNSLLIEQVASSDMLRELGTGFVLCEGLADTVESVEASGDEIWVEADVRRSADLEMRTCGGHGVKQHIPRQVASSLMMSPDAIYAATREIMSDTWQQTGGVHCSVLVRAGDLIAKSCDIGRHNTVDKVVGFAELAGIDRGECAIGCTGRQPSGMVGKVANAGIPILISRAAPTDKGIILAEEANVTMINFSRGNRFTIFAHPERISGILPALHHQKNTDWRYPGA
ncbi:MAG TPA: formate dehydrogenase accessory sulfurtransferase FdhD [Methanoculleus sp.]|nr:formate dehydrogenase accessory sulfurtransferase FdhD [Methanoculleus sp.]